MTKIKKTRKVRPRKVRHRKVKTRKVKTRKVKTRKVRKNKKGGALRIAQRFAQRAAKKYPEVTRKILSGINNTRKSVRLPGSVKHIYKNHRLNLPEAQVSDYLNTKYSPIIKNTGRKFPKHKKFYYSYNSDDKIAKLGKMILRPELPKGYSVQNAIKTKTHIHPQYSKYLSRKVPPRKPQIQPVTLGSRISESSNLKSIPSQYSKYL